MLTTAPFFDVQHLLTLVTVEAQRWHDGHFAILAFTSGYKVMFGTPNLDNGQGRAEVAALPNCPTLRAALLAALVAGQGCEALCTAPGRSREERPRLDTEERVCPGRLRL